MILPKREMYCLTILFTMRMIGSPQVLENHIRMKQTRNGASKMVKQDITVHNIKMPNSKYIE
jgi:hypothetical protein